MPRDAYIQLEQDYQDIYGDFLQVSEMVLECEGKERQALLKLRRILQGTLEELNKELNRELEGL